MSFIIAKKWNYYNDFDAGAAEWARELIKKGLVPDGEVDERSILDVSADDVRGFIQCHFFCGILGWSYALRLAGWPDDRPCWTGSPPCQPFSVAGEGNGRDDERHLAPHFVNLVRTGRPPVLFGEQVASSAVFGRIAGASKRKAAKSPEWAWWDDLSDRLEAAHYAVGASDIPAAGVGAPHIRQRTFFGAYDLELAASGMVNGVGSGLEGLAWDGGDRDEPGRQRRGAGEARDTSGQVERVERLCDVERLADAGSERRQQESGSSLGHEKEDGTAGRIGREPNADNITAGDGEVFRLADMHGDGRDQGRERCASAGHDGAFRDGAGVGLAGPWKSYADWFCVCWRTNSPECETNCQCHLRDDAPEGRKWDADEGWISESSNIDRVLDDALARLDTVRPGPLDGFWRDADWIFCRDGKWRPVEPGTRPLAAGVSGRVGALRGYGNAICPQAAAQFIETFTEIMIDL